MVSVLLLASCHTTNKERLNERVSYWKGDKVPYGTFVAFNNLSSIFPLASITSSNFAPVVSSYNEMDDSAVAKEEIVTILVASDIIPSKDEALEILYKVWQGEHVFISAGFLGKELLDSLKLQISSDFGNYAGDSLKHTIFDPVSGEETSFTYPGFLADNYFTKMDSSIVSIIGTNSKGQANCIRLTYESSGSIILSLSPFTFTNFFLLHKNNNHYYNKVLSYLPVTATQVEWNDYFRTKEESNNFSSLGFLMKQTAFKWAILLVLVLCAILFLVESKRKQRQVNRKPALHNSSVDFVNTVGRLYFQQSDHRNLALKMIAHFLDHVRTRYNIPTSSLDSLFIEKLSYKGGFDQEDLADLVADIKQIEINHSITAEELFMFSKKIEKFK